MQRRISPLPKQDTPGLLQALARVPDPRDAGGRIHPLPGLLAIAIAAVVSGSSRVVKTVKWAADLPDAVWDRLGATRDAFTVARRVPDDSTLCRVLTGIDAGALDAAVCRWLLSRAVLTGAGRRVMAVCRLRLKTDHVVPAESGPPPEASGGAERGGLGG
ncbi:transposase family protein, partial [Micromonospora zamorensis]|uniref:transposase family protein n=1 Tax=Micromonospora zamorensis TaxID=709883 RepID=UPI0033E71098